MLESTMAAAAGGSGGIMGQLGQYLSAPRRFAWDALGLPEDGASLLNETFGMDKESPWTKALGVGAEMVLDPLTYAGGLLGGPLAKMGAQAVNARRTAGLGTEIAELTAARRAAQEGLVARAGHEAETAARYGSQAQELGALHDVPSIAGGRTRSYDSYTPTLADDMTNAGMAHVNDEGKLVTLGEGIPASVEQRPLQTQNRGRMTGTVMDINPDAGNPYTHMDPLLPDELAWLKDASSEHLGNRWRRLRVPDAAYNQGHLLDEFAAHHTAAANASRPMPGMGGYLRDNFQPTSNLTEGFLGQPLDSAFSATQTALASALERKKMLESASLANALGTADYAKLAGGSFMGSLGLGSGRG